MKKALLVLLISFNCYAEVIDGNTDAISSPRDLSLNSIEAGGLYNYRLTTSIKNYTLTNLSGQDRLWTFTAVSKMVLENTTLELDGTFTFSHGSIQIVGNCVINGSSDFNKFRFESHLIYIAEGSELKIGPGVNFEYAPTSSISNGIVFADSTSKLTLQDATLTVSNRNGLHLIKGQLRIEGNSTVDNFFNKDNDSYVERRITYTEAALFLGYGTTKYGDCKLKITSGAKLTVKNAGIVFQNKGINSFDCSDGNGVLKIDKKGSFLVIENENTSLGGVELDAGILSSELKRSAPVSAIFIDGYNIGGSGALAASCRWHPSGKYLAVGTDDDVSGYEIRIFNFDGTSLNTGSPVAQYNWAGGSTQVRSLTWSKDGKYLMGNLNIDGAVRVFYFDEAGMYSMPGTELTSVSNIRATWSSDGQYLLIIGINGVNGEARVYDFDGTNLSLRAENIINPDWTWGIGIDMSVDNKYICICAHVVVSDPAVSIYRFEDGQVAPNNTTPVVSLGTSDTNWSAEWSKDGRFLLLAAQLGGFLGTQVYEFDGSTLTRKANEPTETYYSKWTNNGEYICSFVNVGDSFQVYPFNGNNTDDQVMNTIIDDSTLFGSVNVWDLDVSPDGKFVAIAADTSGENDEIRVIKLNYNLDNQKSFLLKDSTINLIKDMTLRDINLKLK